MIRDDGIIALVGPNRSAHAIPIGALAEEYKLPMITTTATNPALTASSDFVFMAAFTDAYQGAVMAKFASTELGLTSVALLTQSGEIYSEGISDFFVTNFTAAGGTIAAREFYEIVDTDFTEQLTRIAAATPEALFIAGWVQQVGPITQQARALPLLNAAGEPTLLLGTDTWDNPILLDNEEAQIEGSFFSGHFSAATDKPSGKAFVEAYQAAYGELPLGGHAVSYDATHVMLTAIERAGSFEGRRSERNWQQRRITSVPPTSRVMTRTATRRRVRLSSPLKMAKSSSISRLILSNRSIICRRKKSCRSLYSETYK